MFQDRPERVERVDLVVRAVLSLLTLPLRFCLERLRLLPPRFFRLLDRRRVDRCVEDRVDRVEITEADEL